MLRWAHGDDVPPGHRPAGPLFRRWYDAYVDVLARAHLRAARPALTKESAASSEAVDALNERYGRTVVGFGHCGDASNPAAGYAGAKIAYGRIPDLEDFR